MITKNINSEFMRGKVNLETTKTTTARTSRDNLVSNVYVKEKK